MEALAAVSDTEYDQQTLQARFEALQQRLVPLWESIGRHFPGGAIEEANTVVVIPSLTVDLPLTSAARQAYEERFLFMLLLLRQPHIRLIYVTGLTIHPSIIEYYLDLLPGVVATSARQRLLLVSPMDASDRPLSRKLLERPHLIRQIRSLIPDLERAHVVPFNTTDLERELALHLGVPMYAADPRFYAFGTKSGCRRIFAEEGVPHPLGVEDIFTVDALVDAIATMRTDRPSLAGVITKLNDSVAGAGNAIIDLSGLPLPDDPSERAIIAQRVREMRIEYDSLPHEAYVRKLEEGGAIVEELITGEELHSPSAQVRATPLGEIELLSTHDQVLGGPTGQTYFGARFPANPGYGPAIMREAAKVARRLAREGVVGRFALDFVVTRTEEGEWQPYAIEINLRKGGTTHPFLTLAYLTDGRYEAESATFLTTRGAPKYYVATDHLESPLYRAFTPDDLFEIVSRHRLHFDHACQAGVVLHMMSAVGTTGRLGLTAIADSPEEADALYQRTIAVLDEEAKALLEEEGRGQDG